MTVTVDSKYRIASFAPVSGRVGLSDSTFSTITIVAEAIVTIFDSLFTNTGSVNLIPKLLGT